MIHLDTTFLVDLLRESRREKPGQARAFREIEEEELVASVHVLCELPAGVELSRNREKELERVDTLCEGFTIVYPSTRFPLVYGELLASLERKGQRIGLMDLLIATSAVIDGCGRSLRPVAFRNRPCGRPVDVSVTQEISDRLQRLPSMEHTGREGMPECMGGRVGLAHPSLAYSLRDHLRNRTRRSQRPDRRMGGQEDLGERSSRSSEAKVIQQAFTHFIGEGG